MRTISTEGLQQLFAQESEDVFLTIIEIDHPDLTVPLYYVNDMVNLTYNSNTYAALPFRFTLAADAKDSPPSAKLVLDNINRDLISTVRSTTEAPTITADIVRKAASDSSVTHEIGPFEFRMDNITYTAHTLDATLGYEADLLNESAVKDLFAPNLCPGLF